MINSLKCLLKHTAFIKKTLWAMIEVTALNFRSFLFLFWGFIVLI